MKSIAFPKMFSLTKTNVVSDYDATLQNLKLLLYSEKGEMWGDPYFGTRIKKFTFDPNDSVLRDLLIDSIYTSIAEFMPQIRIERKNVNVVSEGTKVICTIVATNMVTYKTNTYTLVLYGG